MKVLVVGGGGREHAIIRKLKESPRVTEIFAAPGNGGISYDATCVPVAATDIEAIAAWAAENKMDYVVVAPDDPLAMGLVDLLEEKGIHAAVVDMYCIKPFDKNTLLQYAAQVKTVIAVEEHAPTGGLGSMVAQAVSENCPKTVKCLTLPDAPAITGTSLEVFDYYGLNAGGISNTAKELLQ